ncbi:MAG: PucR family transcriptional regulator [Cellulomonadaceae bacterium]|nr:PucR family transcriptional regulator [Cellulomonadaceae bacterium]
MTDRASLDLRICLPGGPGALDRPISWAHSTELEDPTPFLEGDELLLTTGMQLAGDALVDTARARRMVERLVGVRVCGIGFGVGLHHREVPPSLLAAADKAALPVIEIPRATPFIALTKAISRAFMDDELERLQRSYHTQRQLLAAAGGQDATRAIVRRTAELVGGWVALVDPSGAVVEASHQAAAPLVRASAHGRRSRPGQITFETQGGTDIASYPMFSPGGQHVGHLVAGHRGETGSVDHALVSVATTLLSLSTYRSHHAERAITRMRSVLMRQLLDGDVRPVAPFADDIWGGLPTEPFHVLRLTGARQPLAAVRGALEPFRRVRGRDPHVVAFGEVDGALWAVVGTGDLDGLLERLTDSEVTVGASSAAWWDETGRARREATEAVTTAQARALQHVRFGQTEDLGLAGLLGEDRLRAFAELRLAPLREVDGRHGAPGAVGAPDDVALLTCWLRHHSQGDPAARELGIHRHTLRKRLHRVEQALGVDLDSPTVRAELWLACQALPRG